MRVCYLRAVRALLGIAIMGLSVVGALSGCVTAYQDGLGYRARRAAERADLAAFEGLMSEAAQVKTRSPLLKPRRTVLTHFLALGGHPRFFATIEAWQAKGWVSDNLTCSVHRARFRHTAGTDPQSAAASAQVCLQRARAAAQAGGRSWEVEACLDEAPFLTQSSTVALLPYLLVVVDPTEPRALRRALLEGMTKVYLQDRHIRTANAPALPASGHRALAWAQWQAAAKRYTAIVDAVRHETDLALLAAGTDLGAVELERVALTESQSFLWAYAFAHRDPELRDLAYAWVRATKGRPKSPRHFSLGLWSPQVEPRGDAYWYGCVSRPKVRTTYASASVSVTPVRTQARHNAQVRARCARLDATMMGPFPMKATLRGSVTASVAYFQDVQRVKMKMAPVELGGTRGR